MISDPSLAVADDSPSLVNSAAEESTGATAIAEAPEPARRVTLNPTGTEEFKAVPSVNVTPTAAPPAARDIDAEAEQEARPLLEERRPEPRERASIPAAEGLDAALEAEINAALGGEQPAVGAVATAAATAATELPSEDSLHQGKRLKGRVAVQHGENLFLDLGFRSQGILPLKQFEGKEVPAIGVEVEVIVNSVNAEEGLIHVRLPSGKQRVSGNWNAVQPGQVVDCMVTKANKGGLEVMVSTLRGFLPAGQIDLRYIENLEPYIGQKLTVKIVEASKSKRNLIVSRRALLEEERREAKEKILGTLEVGQTLDGMVKSVRDFGAFVDLGGVDGFLHIGQISWQHIKHPSEVLSEDLPVKVKVISINEDKSKIGLSLKQLSQSPWDLAPTKYFPSQTVHGTVTRITDFGAFVELEPGIEGMIHISELDYKRIARVADVVSVGQELDVQVRDVDSEKRRIGLSLKALRPKPEAAKPEEPAESETAPPPPRRKSNLKGGKGEPPLRGGLFGNPSDFH